MEVFPQVLKNVRVASKSGWDLNPNIQQAIENAKAKLGQKGRIFVRPSGTEPVIRVMGEHPDEDLVAQVVDEVSAVIEAEQGA